MSDAVERTLEKLKHDDTPYGVAAILIGECGPRGLDGVRWEFLITDGSTTETIVAQLSETEGGYPAFDIPASVLEHAVEHRSGSYARETRLGDLMADVRARGPLRLRKTELRLSE